MKNDNILSMLGLAKRGGNIVSGEFSVENAIRDGSAYLVVIAKDASDKTKKKFILCDNFIAVFCGMLVL